MNYYYELINTIAKINFAVARSSACHLSVCNARAPYRGGRKFRQHFYGIWYVGHPLTSKKNFTEIVPEEALRRGT